MSRSKTGKAKTPPVRVSDLKGFKYFKRILPMLDRLHDSYQHSNRTLHYDQYISLILFYFFNPILTSLRGLQASTDLKKVQKTLGIKNTSLTCLSEASHLFDASLLEPVLAELARQAAPVETNPDLLRIQEDILAIDGSLLPALPKMLWALWVDDQHRAAKVHLSLSVLKHVPTKAVVTDGNANEKKVFRKMLSAGKLYLIDAGYSEYRLFHDIMEEESSFVGRLRDNAVWKTIEERPLTTEAEAVGVKRDMIVHLGSSTKREDCPKPVRIVEVESFDIPSPGRPGDANNSRQTGQGTLRRFLLVTDRTDLPAEVVALLYKHRWQVELFFRWFKCILSCQHLIANSLNGLTIQVYCALIVSILISLWTGKKPTKRTYEMICFYFSGWADEDELFEHIDKLKEVKDSGAN